MTPGAYLDQIERAFVKAAARGLMLSARDLPLVERWQRAGVPVDVVEAGIQQAFSGKKRPRKPSLAYAVPAVEDAIRAWRARNVGASTGFVPAPVDDDAALSALADQYAYIAVDAAFRPACDRAVGAMRDLVVSHDESPESLKLVEMRLCRELLDAMSPPDRVAVESKVDERLIGQRVELPVREAQLWRAIRDHLHLPALVIHREEW